MKRGRFISYERAQLALARRDFDDLAGRWSDEAAAAAVGGNPRRAAYVYDMAGSVQSLADRIGALA